MIQETSLEAYRASRKYATTAREDVLRFLRGRERGASIEELSIAVGRRQSAICGTVRPLAKEGIIKDSGRRTRTTSGCKAILWVLV
jgi:predicted transcriptional regulator